MTKNKRYILLNGYSFKVEDLGISFLSPDQQTLEEIYFTEDCLSEIIKSIKIASNNHPQQNIQYGSTQTITLPVSAELSFTARN